MPAPTWRSKSGFILAALGSAVGLGNIWRFPSVAGENGGGAFVLVYLGAVALLGLPLVVAELSIGRNRQSDPVTAFEAVSGRAPLRWVGWLGIAACMSILAYYPVITGWVANFLIRTAAHAASPREADALALDFDAIVADPAQALGWHAMAVAAATAVVAVGVRSGIEKISKLLMPVFLALAAVLAAWGLTREGAGAALEFIFRPDWSYLARPSTYLAAIGQAFFSIGVAMAVMVAYGGYMSRQHRLPPAAGTIVLGDTAVAMLAGLILFPAVFTLGLDPAQGTTLAFTVLPQMFSAMPGGIWLGIGFYLLLLIAALTSLIALLEAPVSVAVQRWHVPRASSAAAGGLVAFVLGIPAALGYGLLSRPSPELPTWLDIADAVASDVLLPLNAVAIALIAGWIWSRDRAVAAAELRDRRWQEAWRWSLRVTVPLAILGAMAGKFGIL
jgi:NSS family neurotransmitter:Na+ symporter